MQSFLDNIMMLGRTRLIALFVTGVGLFAALFFGLSAVMTPSYSPLYRDLSPGSAGQIVTALEQDGFNVKLESGGTVVSVPVDDVARARMALADNGLPVDGTPGWELFDDQSSLGMNSFMQKVNRLRALEGELARSIQTINGIDSARVHLVLPEREAFSRDRAEPSASIIVRGQGSQQISRREAQSIRALVAAAVPDLAPSKVTVLSADGEIILAEDGQGTGESSLQSARATIEDRLSRNISDILTARVGAGNARVTVSVDLTSERQVTRAQTFDPAQRVVRSTETREDTSADQSGTANEVGASGNIPAALAGDSAGATNTNSTNSTNEIVNYEIGSTNTETIREPGQIARISVAVLVNGIYNVSPEGTTEFAARDPAELERLNSLVKSAIGFDEARGDSVSVDSLRFIDYSMDVGDPIVRPISQVFSDNLMSILRGIFALAIVAIVLAFGFVPILRRIGEAPRQIALDNSGPVLPDATERKAISPSSTPNMQRPAQIGARSDEAVLHSMPNPSEELVRFSSVQGGIQRGWINSVSDLIEREVDDSLKVVKSWLAEGV